MSVGYTLKTKRLNDAADPVSPGVILGKFCIERDIPVFIIADTFEVSRQTVYNWFTGHNKPNQKLQQKIFEYISENL